MKQPKRRQVMRSIDKQYILNVKKKLPKGKNRETLLENLRESVHTYYEEHLSADLDELYKRFGTPDEIAESFSDASSPSSILTAKDLPKRILLITAAALAAICIITIVQKNNGKNPSGIVDCNDVNPGSPLSADVSYSDDDIVPDAIVEDTSRPLGDYEKYNIHHVGDIITCRIPEGDEHPGPGGAIEASVSGNGEEIGQTAEYSVIDAVLYENLEASGLTQEELDRVYSSSKADWIQDMSSCRFAVITLKVKHFRKEGVQNLLRYADILNLAKSFHLLTYALLDNGLNYDPTPLVWYKSDGDSPQGIYFSSKDSDKTETEAVYRIGFLLSDMTKPQDGLLLHIESEPDSNIYVDLGIDG